MDKQVEDQEGLELRSNSELMSALVEANSSKEKLEALLKERALALLDGIPGGLHQERELQYTFDLTGEGAVTVHVSTFKLQHGDTVNLIERLEQLPGVTVEPIGGIHSGTHNLQVKVRFDQESTLDQSSEVLEVRESMIENLQEGE